MTGITNNDLKKIVTLCELFQNFLNEPRREEAVLERSAGITIARKEAFQAGWNQLSTQIAAICANAKKRCRGD